MRLPNAWPIRWGGSAADVLNGPRHVVGEVAEGQPVDSGRAVAHAAMVHSSHPVSGRFEVLRKGIEVFDAAPQRGDADHEVAAALLDNFDLTVFHRNAHGGLLWMG